MSVLRFYNEEAYDKNVLAIHKSQAGCCNGDATFCKYTAELGSLANITALTIEKDGDPVVLEVAPEGSTPRNVRKALALAIKGGGYDPYYEDAWKGISLKDDAELAIIGEVVPVSITVDGSEINFSKLCEVGRACNFAGSIAYDTDAGSASVDGSAPIAIGDENGFPAGNTAPVLAALEVAFPTAVKITVTEDGAYNYVVTLAGKPVVIVNDQELEAYACKPQFVA